MRRLIFAAALLALMPALAIARDRTVPDPKMTPGALNPAVTQATIGSTICKPLWTKSVRPPASFTNKLKRSQLAAYGYGPQTDLHSVEEDHRVPLELGGAPREPKNLWPEPWVGAHGARSKDRLEKAVARDVCAGRLTLAQGHAIFIGDFWQEYDRRFGAGH
ncbi:MAG: hypothetical protein ACREFC_04600 [Stellaceae bacterium]